MLDTAQEAGKPVSEFLKQIKLTESEKQELQSIKTVYYYSPRNHQSLDDEEGYYLLSEGDHLLYRFEVLKVLGKGSFAQVISAYDHLSQVEVAIKINRNTEIDHKFAEAEAKLLQTLMQADPSDCKNIVRLKEHLRFREHQCFVFELLHKDLFEHMKDNDFIGFPVATIRSYAR